MTILPWYKKGQRIRVNESGLLKGLDTRIKYEIVDIITDLDSEKIASYVINLGKGATAYVDPYEIWT